MAAPRARCGKNLEASLPAGLDLLLHHPCGPRAASRDRVGQRMIGGAGELVGNAGHGLQRRSKHRWVPDQDVLVPGVRAHGLRGRDPIHVANPVARSETSLALDTDRPTPPQHRRKRQAAVALWQPAPPSFGQAVRPVQRVGARIFTDELCLNQKNEDAVVNI